MLATFDSSTSSQVSDVEANIVDSTNLLDVVDPITCDKKQHTSMLSVKQLCALFRCITITNTRMMYFMMVAAILTFAFSFTMLSFISSKNGNSLLFLSFGFGISHKKALDESLDPTLLEQIKIHHPDVKTPDQLLKDKHKNNNYHHHHKIMVKESLERLNIENTRQADLTEYRKQQDQNKTHPELISSDDAIEEECIHSVESSDMAVDDHGRVCTRIAANGCCLGKISANSCYGCGSNIVYPWCCSSYEYCVACCMKHTRPSSSPIIHADLGSYKRCRIACRTNSDSVYDDMQQSYKLQYVSDKKARHCFKLLDMYNNDKKLFSIDNNNTTYYPIWAIPTRVRETLIRNNDVAVAQEHVNAST